MKIEDIKNFLYLNPTYFSKKNNIPIKDIKTTQSYYFIGECGHEYQSSPKNAIKNNKMACPYCSNHRVLKGFNDIATTAPEYAEFLLNKDDKYKYTKSSHIKLYWKCPDCNDIIYKSPDRVLLSKSLCKKCNKTVSYGERFISNLLAYLCVAYEKEKVFEWSDKKRYDFYIPRKKCIIEVHGKQHYSSKDFSKMGGNDYLFEQWNDEYKKELAIKNNIQNYIIINCEFSNLNWIKKSILSSDLPYVLEFFNDEIDWKYIESQTLNNIDKEICFDYNSGVTDIRKLASKYKLSYNSIVSKLKKGTKIGWCNYDINVIKHNNYINNGKRIIETMSKRVIQMDQNGNYINEYPSLQEAQRVLKISHIWDCIVGKRKTAGGFLWRYKDVD